MVVEPSARTMVHFTGYKPLVALVPSSLRVRVPAVPDPASIANCVSRQCRSFSQPKLIFPDGRFFNRIDCKFFAGKLSCSFENFIISFESKLDCDFVIKNWFSWHKNFIRTCLLKIFSKIQWSFHFFFFYFEILFLSLEFVTRVEWNFMDERMKSL